MPKKVICNLTTEELKKAYLDENRTIDEMCEIIGVKSPITAAKILHAHGISTNANERKKQKAMQSMTDDEFMSFLKDRYEHGWSMIKIGEELGISASGVRKYFVKYNIDRRNNTDFFKNVPSANPNWHGGVRRTNHGYIEIFCPDHPMANKRKCVYEHQLVMEQHIGRFLHPGEVVHHIDGDKQNNNIANLLLLTNQDHAKLHAILRRGKKMMGDD